MFALGLMSKPMLVTVPFLLLLLDYWPLDRFRPRGRRRSTGRIALVARSLAGALAAGGGKDPAPGPGGGELRDCPVDPCRRSRWPIMSSDCHSRHAWPMPWFRTRPIWASLFIPSIWLPIILILGSRLPMARAAGALVLLVAITAVAAYFWRRLPYLLVGWLWFLGMLVPVIGLVRDVPQARADHYTYLSQIGLSIALAWSVWSVYRSRQSLQAARWRRWMLAVVSGAAVLLLAAVAWRQTSYWRNAETVWTRAIACTEQNAMAHYSLAYLYAQQGRT